VGDCAFLHNFGRGLARFLNVSRPRISLINDVRIPLTVIPDPFGLPGRLTLQPLHPSIGFPLLYQPIRHNLSLITGHSGEIIGRIFTSDKQKLHGAIITYVYRLHIP